MKKLDAIRIVKIVRDQRKISIAQEIVNGNFRVVASAEVDLFADALLAALDNPDQFLFEHTGAAPRHECDKTP